MEACAELNLTFAVDGVGRGSWGVKVGVVLKRVFVDGVERTAAAGNHLMVEEVERLGEKLKALALSEVDMARKAQINIVEIVVAESVASQEWQAVLASCAHKSKASGAGCDWCVPADVITERLAR